MKALLLVWVVAASVLALHSVRGQQVPVIDPPAALLSSPCDNAQEHSLPLPTNLPPSQFVAFEKHVLAFLQRGEYKRLGWCSDKGTDGSLVRDTGPFVKGVYYGTHPAVRVYYSPRMMNCLINPRPRPIPHPPLTIHD